jgi:hypothetical protein
MKNIASLVIAGIALVVSLGRFGYDMWQARKTKRSETLRQAGIAFRLGVDLMEQWQMTMLVGQGDSKDIEEFREQVLLRVGSSQVLADQLGIKLDLKTWLNRKDAGLVIGGTRNPFAELRGIIEVAIPQEKVLAAYEVGVWANFLNWALRVGPMKGDATAEIQHYQSLVGQINGWINQLGVDERFNPGLQEPLAIAEEAKRVVEAMPKKLRTAR